MCDIGTYLSCIGSAVHFEPLLYRLLTSGSATHCCSTIGARWRHTSRQKGREALSCLWIFFTCVYNVVVFAEPKYTACCVCLPTDRFNFNYTRRRESTVASVAAYLDRIQVTR